MCKQVVSEQWKQVVCEQVMYVCVCEQVVCVRELYVSKTCVIDLSVSKLGSNKLCV